MTTTYTPALSLPLQGLGDNANAWGGILNTQAFQVLDDAIAAIYTKSIAGSGTTILGASEPGQNESKKRAYVFTGALTGNSTVLWEQSVDRFFSVTNNTTGAFTLTLGVNNGSGSPAGTTVTIAQGQTQNFYSDGTNLSIGSTTSSVIPNYIFGLGLSNDIGIPNTKVDVATGGASDSTGSALLVITSSKTVDFTLNGAGGLDTGAIAASTWYAILVIGGPSGTAVMATKETAGSAVSPTMPSGYTLYRYIGSVLTDGSSHIRSFVQKGQRFYWAATEFIDISLSSIPATPTLYTLTVPLGVEVTPILSVWVQQATSSAQVGIYLRSPSQNTTPVTNDFGNIYISPSGTAQNSTAISVDIQTVTTNTSGQIYAWAPASYNVYGVRATNQGWIDPHVSPVY